MYEPHEANKMSKDNMSTGAAENGERKLLTSKEKIFELENMLQEREL